MKIRNISFTLAVLACFSSFLLTEKQMRYEENEAYESEEAMGMEEDIVEREAWLNKMLADPATGKIPERIREKEIKFASTLPVEGDLNKTNRMGYWVSRGPDNVGGRTRAVVIDKTNENVLIAGATSGGIWRSENGGASWVKVTSMDSFVNVTCITQDKRKGKEKIWYAGTGEYYGGSVPGQYFTGNGLLKSTDGGKTWIRLKNTNSNNVTFDLAFDFNHKVAVNNAIDSIDVLFVANYGCIYRSLNGGTSWSIRRGGLTQASTWTDVAVTSSGIVYATLSGGGNNPGIWRSKDNGTTWANITPSFLAGSTGRIVIGIAPSDENQVYFAANTPNFGKQSTRFDGGVEWNSLWKYSYVSGDGSSTGGQWEDRSANIPALGGAFGNYISQGGYCLDVQVKPDNPDVVFLGGTNLYRSNDGFKSTTQTHWIGGYAVGTTLPDFKTYANHHPDQHSIIFYPSNPNKAISSNDGGIQRTDDCTDNAVVWNSLNNGYLSTQFYTIAIDKTSTNFTMIGGLQDNGTLLRPENSNNWNLPLSYDGSYCFVGSNASEYYMSIQEGRVFRLQLDANYKPIKSARIDCKDALKSKYEFINPFTPDIANFKRLYIPNGDRIWRNNDVTQIPLHDELDSTATNIGWDEMSNTNIGDATDAITAITSASNDILFYGTQKGKLWRIRNASSGNPLPESIRGTNFPTGYINCLATHPTDTSKLYAVFTNYGIISLFYSSNAGKTWQAIAGNLEENVSGSGNGPSCRWFKVVPIGNTMYYYVGTSTGLFATDSLNGNNTVWVKQATDKIGYNIVTMMEHRTTDGLMAVSTFGAGVFSAFLTSEKDQTSIQQMTASEIIIYPNPSKDVLNIKLEASTRQASYSIYNMSGKLIKEGTLNKQIRIEELLEGAYILKLNIDGKFISKKFIKE